MPSPLPSYATLWKSISRFPGWSTPEPDTGYIWFDAPLEIAGVTERGFVLHGGCYHDKPDCNLTFELRVGKATGRRCVPLARIDWRSLQGGHTNPRKGNSPWAGKRVSFTHFHTFDLNWIAEMDRMRGVNLPLAMEIDQALQTFEEARDYTGNQFRINNIDVVTPPDWVYKLL